MVRRVADIFLVCVAVEVPLHWGPRIIHTYELCRLDRLVANRDHHVAASATNVMPRKRERLIPAVELGLYLLPTERLVAFDRRLEPVDLKMRPPATDTITRRLFFTALVEAELLVRLGALAHVLFEEMQDHLTARCPTPLGRP